MEDSVTDVTGQCTVRPWRIAEGHSVEMTAEHQRGCGGIAHRSEQVRPAGLHPHDLDVSARSVEYVHGVSGLDGPKWGEPTVPEAEESAHELIVRVLREHPELVTLIPTGPLTNIALVLSAYPELKPNIREIVLMGGSTGRGNDTPYAEFNIRVDPDAADIVFCSGVPVTMCGLNITHQALATPDVIERLRALGTPMGDLCVELLTFFSASYLRTWGFTSPPLHDPVAVARVIDPSLVEVVSVPVAIETQGRYTAGATCVDLHHLTGEPDNALVAMRLDAPRFWDLMIGAIASYE